MSSMTAVTSESSSSSLLPCEKSNQVRKMINDSISIDGREKIASILRDVNQLNDLERLLLYMQLPGSTSELIKDTVTSKNTSSSNNKSCSNSSWVSGKKAEHEIALTYSWIKSHLERDQSFSLPKQEVYDDYKEFCQNSNIDSLCVADFGKAMKQIFPSVKPRRLGQRGSSKYCYSGLKKKFSVHTPSLPQITCESNQMTFQSGSDGDASSSDSLDTILASISHSDVNAFIKDTSSDVSSNASSNLSTVSSNTTTMSVCAFSSKSKSVATATTSAARGGKRKQSLPSLTGPGEKKRRGRQVQQQQQSSRLLHPSEPQEQQQHQQQPPGQQAQHNQHHQKLSPQLTTSLANIIIKQEQSSDSLHSVGHLESNGTGFHSTTKSALNSLFGESKSPPSSTQRQRFTNSHSLDSTGLQLSLYDSNCDQGSNAAQFESTTAPLVSYDPNELQASVNGASNDHASSDQISQLRKLLEQNLPNKKEILYNTFNDVLNTSTTPSGQQEVLDDGCNAYVYDAYNSSVIDSSVGNLLATSEELQNSSVVSEMSSAQMSLAQSPLVSSQDSPLNQRYFQPITHQAYCESNCDSSPPSDSVTIHSVGLSLTPSNSGSPFLSPRSTPVHTSGHRSRNDSGQNASSSSNSSSNAFYINPPLQSQQTHQGQQAAILQQGSQSPYDSPVASTFTPSYILGYNQLPNQLYPA